MGNGGVYFTLGSRWPMTTVGCICGGARMMAEWLLHRYPEWRPPRLRSRALLHPFSSYSIESNVITTCTGVSMGHFAVAIRHSLSVAVDCIAKLSLPARAYFHVGGVFSRLVDLVGMLLHMR